MSDTKTPKKPCEYICKLCNFKCSNKKDYNRHLLTAKHKMIYTDLQHQKTYTDLQQSKSYVCKCGKSYKHRQGVYTHKKKCNKPDILTNSHTAQDAQLITILNEQCVEYASQIAMTEIRAAKKLEEIEARAAKQVQQVEAHAADLVKQSEAHIAKQINIMVEAVQKIASSR